VNGGSRAARTLAGALVSGVVLAGCGDAEQAGSEGVAAEASSAATEHNRLTPAEQAAGWSLLFDGRSTDGWRRYGGEGFPSDRWVVENGELISRSTGGDMEGGDIVTDAEFADFELVFDFKVGPEGNSGVFYRVEEHEGAALWQVAAEYQVLDDPAYIAMGTMDMETHLTGDNYDLHAAAAKTMHPTGEWNTGRILVRGDHVEHWLNGRMTVSFDMYTDDWEARVAESKFGPEQHYARAQSGSIALQDHGTPVWFRNIKIRPITGADSGG
jgi:hypothetical protein